MLSRRLIRRGFEVIFAVDGKQGVEAARREKPDIILMDMGLPVMDGWEATRCIKSDDAIRGVSVIGLSARTMSGDRDKAIEAGWTIMTSSRSNSIASSVRSSACSDWPRSRCVERGPSGRHIDSAQASGASALNVFVVTALLRSSAPHYGPGRRTVYDFPKTAKEGSFAAYGPRLSQLCSSFLCSSTC